MVHENMENSFQNNDETMIHYSFKWILSTQTSTGMPQIHPSHLNGIMMVLSLLVAPFLKLLAFLQQGSQTFLFHSCFFPQGHKLSFQQCSLYLKLQHKITISKYILVKTSLFFLPWSSLHKIQIKSQHTIQTLSFKWLAHCSNYEMS